MARRQQSIVNNRSESTSAIFSQDRSQVPIGIAFGSILGRLSCLRFVMLGFGRAWKHKQTLVKDARHDTRETTRARRRNGSLSIWGGGAVGPPPPRTPPWNEFHIGNQQHWLQELSHAVCPASRAGGLHVNDKLQSSPDGQFPNLETSCPYRDQEP